MKGVEFDYQLAREELKGHTLIVCPTSQVNVVVNYITIYIYIYEYYE